MIQRGAGKGKWFQEQRRVIRLVAARREIAKENNLKLKVVTTLANFIFTFAMVWK